ncbi:MAG: glycosyltransferase family 2 protein [Taibaiella sp.]|nr:glycosyltransferase family 2 protein [Taibaiella sp.]
MRSIQSVLEQTYEKWELIIVDDGSDDETETIIRSLTDKRIHYYKAGRVGIAGRIKNIGISMAEGELIAFLDSDDLWHREKLEKQVKGLREHTEAAFSITGGYNFRTEGVPYEYFYKERTGSKLANIFLSFFQSEDAAMIPSLMMWRDAITKAGLFDETNEFTDVDYLIHISSCFPALVLYEPLLYRRVHAGSHSADNRISASRKGIDIIQKYLANKMLPRAIGRKALFRAYIRSGESYLIEKKKCAAIGNFIKAWQYCPASIIPIKKIGKGIFSKA